MSVPQVQLDQLAQVGKCQHTSRGSSDQTWFHTQFARRTAIQVGAISILGLGSNHLVGLRQASAASLAANSTGFGKAKSCIFVFLSGGLAQHESFDMKPEAPENIRGDFKPIATRTVGLQICEHLPLLAARSEQWAVCRSLTHSSKRSLGRPSHHADR